MSTKHNPPEVWGTGKSLLPLFNLISTTTVKQPLAPQEQRCYDALFAHPEGLKSYDLRVLTKCSYPASVVQRLIEKGYGVTCTIEPDGFNTDGKPTVIGRYKLERPAGEGLRHD